MAKNRKPPGDGRIDAVRQPSQTETPDGRWAKRDDETGRFMDINTSDTKPFEGVRKER